MIEAPLVSILIITHNNKGLLEKCLRSVLNTDYPNFEIIVVDNASTDGTVELIRDFMKTDVCGRRRIKVVTSKVNNYQIGLNLGIKECHGKYVAKLDDDTYTDPAWLKELVRVMESDEDIATAQSRALSYFHSGPITESSGYFGYEFDYLGLFYPKAPCNKVTEIFFPIFFAILVRKEVLNHIGQFDPQYVIYFEEVDFGWKARLLGYKNVVVPSSLVYHLGPKKGVREFDIYHARKNHIVTLLANYELKNAIRYTLFYVSLLLLQGIYKLFFHRNRKPITDTLKAISWNIRNVKYIYVKRHKTQAIRKIPDKEIMKYMVKPRPSFWLRAK
jgi:GT2 family glycosyltransferase